jgi:hypothetical protein
MMSPELIPVDGITEVFAKRNYSASTENISFIISSFDAEYGIDYNVLATNGVQITDSDFSGATGIISVDEYGAVIKIYSAPNKHLELCAGNSTIEINAIPITSDPIWNKAINLLNNTVVGRIAYSTFNSSNNNRNPNLNNYLYTCESITQGRTNRQTGAKATLSYFGLAKKPDKDHPGNRVWIADNYYGQETDEYIRAITLVHESTHAKQNIGSLSETQRKMNERGAFQAEINFLCELWNGIIGKTDAESIAMHTHLNWLFETYYQKYEFDPIQQNFVLKWKCYEIDPNTNVASSIKKENQIDMMVNDKDGAYDKQTYDLEAIIEEDEIRRSFSPYTVAF